MKSHEIIAFCRTLADYYRTHGRSDMLWRQADSYGNFDPYKILVSELMLQQTGVSRVTPKYAAFLEQFPSIDILARASLGDVLLAWSGLGYNRRAKFLREAAICVYCELNGAFPGTLEGLQALPGVGPNTAGAIMAYAYDAPTVFVETNVRTVIIHHLFTDMNSVADKEIRAVLAEIIEYLQSSDTVKDAFEEFASPREFYWAMMDYGSFLKKTIGNLNRHSTTYAKQSTFAGSTRQIRGRVIKLLLENDMTRQELLATIQDDRASKVVDALLAEKLIKETKGVLHCE